jgi:hypothetical protein
LTGSKTYDGTTRFSNVHLQGVADERFTLDEATAEFSAVGVNNRFMAVTGAPRSSSFDSSNYQALDVNDPALVNQATITAVPASALAPSVNPLDNLGRPSLTPMGPMPNPLSGSAFASGTAVASKVEDVQVADWLPGLQIIGSGVRLPDRADTMLSDQDFE